MYEYILIIIFLSLHVTGKKKHKAGIGIYEGGQPPPQQILLMNLFFSHI